MSRVLEIVLASVVGLLALAAMLLWRRWAEQQKQERERRLGLEENSGVLVSHASSTATTTQRGWAGSMDRGFARMVEGTGWDATPELVLALMLLVGVLVGGALYMWRDQVGLGVLGVFIGGMIPLATVWMMRNQYRQQVQQQVPDALYLLARSLRAGLSLPQAIDLVAEDGPKPVAGEFARCSASLKLGLSVATAVQMMADRLQLLDINAFASTVGFYQTTGGNLPLLLDRLAAGARDRNQFRGQFWATTAQGRITSVALASAAPLLVIGYLVFQPEHVQGFLESPRGWMVLVVVGIMEVIGVFWVYQILKIDY